MHDVMNIVLFFAMWIQQYVGQVYIVCIPLEDQSYGVMICVCNRSIYGPILWGHDACYNEPDACTEDQSYGTVHVATCI